MNDVIDLKEFKKKHTPKEKYFPETDMPDWSIFAMMAFFGVIIYGGLGWGLYVLYLLATGQIK